MATIVVTNLSSTASVYCSDLYTLIAPSASVTTTRAVSDLSRMASLQALVAAGSVGVAITYSAAEQASGLVNEGETATSQGSKFQSVQTLRFAFAAGAGGSADDVTIYALGTLPYAKMRVLKMESLVATAVGASTLQLRTVSGGAGTLLAATAGTPTGYVGPNTSVTATSQVVSSSSVGLFLRRSDSGIAGEVLITFEWEN